MKQRMIYLSVLILGLTFAAPTFSSVYGQTAPKTEKKAKEVNYTCPMHPEVLVSKPGKCPKCGMDLVIKKEAKKDAPQKKSTSKEKPMTM